MLCPEDPTPISHPLSTCDALVIGGGFYGLYLAEYLSGQLGHVILCEQGSELMRRASYCNQARVHNGYHYPRSILTALRSRVNFPRFINEFGPAIESGFEKIYAIGRRYSKVSANQFHECMRRIGASVRPAGKQIRSIFDFSYIEDVFHVQECAFNADVIRLLMLDRIRQIDVEIRLETKVTRIEQASNDRLRVLLDSTSGDQIIEAGHVFCAGYAQLNSAGVASGLPAVPLKHELTEMALVEVPPHLVSLGITVMDGPFFSCMPFPARKLHTLSHVRYTPHTHWYDGPGEYTPAYDRFNSIEKVSAFPLMMKDSARYLPSIADCRYRDSLWEVKTVMPRSETDDSRPILFKPHYGLRNYHLVMGGKIDNVYDVIDVIGQTLEFGGSHGKG